MLKKLYKYDWKSVSMILIVLHIVLLVYALMGRLGVSFFLKGPGYSVSGKTAQLVGIAGTLYLLAYILFIFGIMIATLVILSMKIQKSLFSDEGYLTHTLPVSPAKLLTSKVLILWTWSVIDILCVVLSIFILLTYRETWSSISYGFQDILKLLSGVYGADDQATAWLFIISVLIEAFFFYTGLILFSICLGSLWQTHKVMGAIVSFFGINIIQALIRSVIMLLVPGLSPFGVTTMSTMDGVTVHSDFNGITSSLFSLIWNLILSAVFFYGSHYIVSRKLNLD